jgi:division/cell wall cluster transcriptional repressor MraZ
MPDADSNVPIFHGDFQYGVDESRRVMIPAKWRPKDPKVVFTALLWPINVEEFLLVLPPERWQMLLDALKPKSLNDKRVATLERVIGATSAPLLLDKVGRFCLPDHLALPAGIEREARFVARLGKFEIWSPKRYQTATAQDKSIAAAMADEINI